MRPCTCTKPHGSAPDLRERVLRSCGVEFFDHPVTPFEDVIRRSAAGAFESFESVVRGLLEMHSKTGMEACPIVLELLHWYLERSTYPRCYVERGTGRSTPLRPFIWFTRRPR